MHATQVYCFLVTGEKQYTPVFIEARLVIAAFNGDLRWMERFQMTMLPGYKGVDEPIQFTDILVPIPSGGVICAN